MHGYRLHFGFGVVPADQVARSAAAAHYRGRSRVRVESDIVLCRSSFEALLALLSELILLPELKWTM